MTSSAIAELERPSRVACSDLLDGVLVILSVIIINLSEMQKRAALIMVNRDARWLVTKLRSEQRTAYLSRQVGMVKGQRTVPEREKLL
jgi:ABC-type arginine transport system ATPase subunit